MKELIEKLAGIISEIEFIQIRDGDIEEPSETLILAQKAIKLINKNGVCSISSLSEENNS